MAEYNAEILANQLGQLGLRLEDEVNELGRIDQEATAAEMLFREMAEKYDDDIAQAFMLAAGSVEMKKATARVDCHETRLARDYLHKDWQILKAQVRTQQAVIQALHRRIEIGRSMLSREKALMGLDR